MQAPAYAWERIAMDAGDRQIPDDPVDGIERRISDARRALGVALRRDVKQAELARVVGVSGATLSQWESGTKRPALTTIPRLAAALQVAPAWLAWGIGDVATPADARKAAEDSAAFPSYPFTPLGPVAGAPDLAERSRRPNERDPGHGPVGATPDDAAPAALRRRRA